MNFSLAFPTRQHEQAAETVYALFHSQPSVDTVLVTNSCARGQAVPESDLDMNVLVQPSTPAEELRRLEDDWQQALDSHPALSQFTERSPYARIHLDLTQGQFTPEVWDDGGGPDGFELGIGNLLAYAAPMGKAGPFYRQLQAQWLPYYGDDLRRQRLDMVRAACLYDLGFIPSYTGRGLHFQAFDRLYRAYQEFLQALFIARRLYPLAYNKWINMQVGDWLGLPELYRTLTSVIAVRDLESGEVAQKAAVLRRLLETWTSGP